eukprot:TRINITY_DN12592_c0_g1_i1.p1 TRINITY_DN12592_c0_g1~~TRINITY_DN12592_c0_g1_i1.p1  ORF type:complete len:198 (+),score=38.89 TRINITY_DN12592_c0_g1_i1:76-594(+)
MSELIGTKTIKAKEHCQKQGELVANCIETTNNPELCTKQYSNFLGCMTAQINPELYQRAQKQGCTADLFTGDRKCEEIAVKMNETIMLGGDPPLEEDVEFKLFQCGKRTNNIFDCAEELCETESKNFEACMTKFDGNLEKCEKEGVALGRGVALILRRAGFNIWSNMDEQEN